MQSVSKRLEAARNYALAEARVMAHMQNGICGFNLKGEDAFYSADPYQEERFLERADGSKEAYHVITYRNMVRP